MGYKKKLAKHAMKEIENIKKYATLAQIAKLDFSKLSPGNDNSCIYGQMTGDCDSKEGVAMINKCCTRLSKDQVLNEQLRVAIEDRVVFNGYSALECYIMTNYANNKEILQYIKGEIDSLDLTIKG